MPIRSFIYTFVHICIYMKSYINVFKALSDPTRLRAIKVLQEAGTELCVCEITDSLNEPQYNVSRHMKVLGDAGLVNDRKDGRWVYYSLVKPKNDFMGHLFDAIKSVQDDIIAEDNIRLRARLAIRTDEGCCATKTDENIGEECCCSSDSSHEDAMEDRIKEIVKEKYGDLASTGGSCCSGSSSCCSDNVIEGVGYGKEDITSVPAESIMGLGCGNPLAFTEIKKSDVVLDLGSGSGFDCFLAAKKAKKVIGVDMTKEMVTRSRELAEQYGYKNVEFIHGEIEHLPIDDDTIDVVMSNCVINLSPDKKKVFNEAYRVLRTGGIIVISDHVLKGDLPEVVKTDPDAWCSCIAGAIKKEDYLRLIKSAGFEILNVDERSSDDIITSITVKARK